MDGQQDAAARRARTIRPRNASKTMDDEEDRFNFLIPTSGSASLVLPDPALEIAAIRGLSPPHVGFLRTVAARLKSMIVTPRL